MEGNKSNDSSEKLTNCLLPCHCTPRMEPMMPLSINQ